MAVSLEHFAQSMSFYATVLGDLLTRLFYDSITSQMAVSLEHFAQGMKIGKQSWTAPNYTINNVAMGTRARTRGP